MKRSIKQTQDDQSIADSHLEDDPFEQNDNLNDFFDGLVPQNRSIGITQETMREKVLKLTDQGFTKQTTLQQKLERKRLQVIKREQREGQVIETQQEEDGVVPEYNQARNDAIYELGTEFWQLGLGKALTRALEEIPFRNPTKVQKQSIPTILSGKDVLVSSMTGSGKTAAFLLPALQRFSGTSRSANYSKVLIVTPTRELALQCFEMLEQLNKYTKCTASLIIGAVPLQKQEVELRKHPDIIIATPGRLVDLLKNSFSIDLQNIEMLIFDEADRLLEMGFEKEVSMIVGQTPLDRQTILFSATLNTGIKKLSELTLKKPVRLSIDYDMGVASGLTQYFVRIRSNLSEDREAHLIALLTKQFTSKTIVFVKTKKDCHRIAIILGLIGMSACELHGNLSQQQRIQAFEDFKAGKYNYLLATDLAARGLDIQGVRAVVNFEIPFEVTRYIHRAGRTARIGSEGYCVTLCLENETRDFKKMIRVSKQPLQALKVSLQRVDQYKRKIFQLELQIKRVLQEEFYERELRKAEMEAKKADNLINHVDEIKNRPKRTWIETFKQKLERQNVQYNTLRNK